MALVFADRVKVRAYTTGTGTFTLGETVPGFQSFDAIGDSNTCYYGIEDHAGNWEVGQGTYSSTGPTLSRDSVISSSNNNQLVNFPAGGKSVFGTIPATVLTSLAGADIGGFDFTGNTISTNDTNDIIITQNVLPSIDSNGTTGFTLGSPSFKWKELFVSNGSIYIGDIKLSNVGGKLSAKKVRNPGEDTEEDDPDDSEADSEIKSVNKLVSNDHEFVLTSDGTLTLDGNLFTGSSSGIGDIEVTVDSDEDSFTRLTVANKDFEIFTTREDSDQDADIVLEAADDVFIRATGDEVSISAANVVSINTNVNEDTKTWEFTTAGNLTLPQGGDIVDWEGNSVLGGTTTTAVSEFVLVNSDGGVYGSNDGETWTGPFDTGLTSIGRVAVGPTRVVYIGRTDPESNLSSLYQTTAWNVTPSVVLDEGPSDWRQVRYFSEEDIFVTVGNIDGVPAYKHSADGITWVTVYLDSEWASTLNGGSGAGPAEFTDIATNGIGFLITSDNYTLGSFYTTSLTTLTSIGAAEWLNDQRAIDEVVFASAGGFTGWHGFSDGEGVWWYYNPSTNPNDNTFTEFTLGEVSQLFSQHVGYSPSPGEFVVGRYSGLDYILIATSDGQVLYWPIIEDGPFVSIPKPFFSDITGITSAAPAVISFAEGTHTHNEKIIISDCGDFNGTFYITSDNELFTDIELATPFDTTALTYTTGGTITFSHGMYIDAMNYANGKFYVANDSEEVFVSTNGGETWTQVASLNPEGPPGDSGAGAGTGTDFMNDIDGFVGSGSSVSTGDITFEGVKIIGAPGGERAGLISLVPTKSLFDNWNFEDWGQFVNIYPTNAYDVPHIHIAAGSGIESTGDLMLGDDTTYVEVNHLGYIGIQSYNSDTSSYHYWKFDTNGAIQFPTLTVPISDNATPSGTGQTLKFSDSTQQAIIYGPLSTSDYNNAERIIIQGAPGYTGTGGEGGDVYLWAGPGGDVDGDGGDIKVRAGAGQGSGTGGYLNFQAGDSDTGYGGHINIESGSGTTGGSIEMYARNGGSIDIRAVDSGTVEIHTESNTWTFAADGATTLPGAVVKSTVAKTGGSQQTVYSVLNGDFTGGYGYTPANDYMQVDSPTGALLTYITTASQIGDVLTLSGGTLVSPVTVTLTAPFGQYIGNLYNALVSEAFSEAVQFDTIAIGEGPAPLDLTKAINKLTDGAYTLADGVEGQVMTLVLQTGVTAVLDLYVVVANARNPYNTGTTWWLYPFTKYDPIGMTTVEGDGVCTLIFTDGAWQSTTGLWAD